MWIEKRIEDIKSSVKPGATDARGRAQTVAMLFATLANDRLPENLAEARATAFLDAITDEPAWAVEAAARMWIRGEGLDTGENAAFVPKPAQLLRLCAKAKAKAWKQASDLQSLLGARLIEEAPRGGGNTERERVVAGFDALAKELGASISESHATRRKEVLAEIERASQVLRERELAFREAHPRSDAA